MGNTGWLMIWQGHDISGFGDFRIAEDFERT